MKALGVLPEREIEHYGSYGFRHTRIAQGDLHVSLVALDGVIGGHDTVSEQLLVVVRGRVVASTREEQVELGVSEAVLWQEGEWHETRSLEPSTILIVEGGLT